MSRIAARVQHDLQIAAELAANGPNWPQHTNPFDCVPNEIMDDIDTVPIEPMFADGSVVMAVPRTLSRDVLSRKYVPWNERATVVTKLPPTLAIVNELRRTGAAGAPATTANYPHLDTVVEFDLDAEWEI